MFYTNFPAKIQIDKIDSTSQGTLRNHQQSLWTKKNNKDSKFKKHSSTHDELSSQIGGFSTGQNSPTVWHLHQKPPYSTRTHQSSIYARVMLHGAFSHAGHLKQRGGFRSGTPRENIGLKWMLSSSAFPSRITRRAWTNSPHHQRQSKVSRVGMKRKLC
jgi:hypothetical protein